MTPEERTRPSKTGAVILAAIFLSSAGCNGMFYWPDQRLYRDPATLSARCEEVAFESLDGTRLHGWFLHASAAGSPRGTVIHFHGNALNVSGQVGFIDWLPSEGYNVFTFDYRGFGKSDGKPSRRGIHLDCLAAIAYARSRPDVDTSRLLLFGQSLGGALSLSALGEGSQEGICGIAVESTFLSYRQAANGIFGGTSLTYPLAWLLVSDAHSPAWSIDRIQPVPLLVIHGDSDRVVPFSQGQALFAAAGAPKEFRRVEGGGHAEALTRFGNVYRPLLADFFDRCLAGRPSSESPENRAP